MLKTLFALFLVVSFISASAQVTVVINREVPVTVPDKYIENKNLNNVEYFVYGYNPFATRLHGKGENITRTIAEATLNQFSFTVKEKLQ